MELLKEAICDLKAAGFVGHEASHDASHLLPPQGIWHQISEQTSHLSPALSVSLSGTNWPFLTCHHSLVWWSEPGRSLQLISEQFVNDLCSERLLQ